MGLRVVLPDGTEKVWNDVTDAIVASVSQEVYSQSVTDDGDPNTVDEMVQSKEYVAQGSTLLMFRADGSWAGSVSVDKVLSFEPMPNATALNVYLPSEDGEGFDLLPKNISDYFA